MKIHRRNLVLNIFIIFIKIAPISGLQCSKMPSNDPKNQPLFQALSSIANKKTSIVNVESRQSIAGSTVTFEDPKSDFKPTLSMVVLDPNRQLKILSRRLDDLINAVCKLSMFDRLINADCPVYCLDSKTEEQIFTLFLLTKITTKSFSGIFNLKGKILRLDNVDSIHRFATADIRDRLAYYQVLMNKLKDLYKYSFPIQKLELKDIYFFEPMPLKEYIEANHRIMGRFEDELTLYDNRQKALELAILPNFIEGRFFPEMMAYEDPDDSEQKYKDHSIVAKVFTSLVLSIECEATDKLVKVDFSAMKGKTSFIDNFECSSHDDNHDEKKLDLVIRRNLMIIEAHKKYLATVNYSLVELPLGTYSMPEYQYFDGTLDGGARSVNKSLPSKTIADKVKYSQRLLDPFLNHNFPDYWKRLVEEFKSQKQLVDGSIKQSKEAAGIDSNNVSKLQI